MDTYFYTDLCYYIRKRSKLIEKKDRSIEKRLPKRLKRVHVRGSNITHMSEFENAFYKFCIEIALISNDSELLNDYTKIGKYPNLVKFKLEELMTNIDSPKVKVLK